MDKRGIAFLHENIFTILILLFIFVSLLYFINQQATGKLTEKQVLAKEVCLMTLASRPGTLITLEHNSGLVIERKDDGIFVNDKKGPIAKGYFYDCYGYFQINSLGEGKTQIQVE